MLELRGVTAGYEGTQVLSDVDLEVARGHVVALLGANGAGKTTLLRVASRLLPLQAGRLLFQGEDVSNAPPHVLTQAGVCHIPEGRGLFPALSVRDNLLLFSRGLPTKDVITRSIEAFPFLELRLNSLAGALSGGERQMLALTRAWLTNPTLVMLDEVSMGLAPLVVDAVYAFMHRLKDEGISLLIVEQYVDRVLQFADRIFLCEMAISASLADLINWEVKKTFLGTTWRRRLDFMVSASICRSVVLASPGIRKETFVAMSTRSECAKSIEVRS